MRRILTRMRFCPQDAATRRLGGDEEDDQERAPSPASSSSSSSVQPPSTQDKGGSVAEGGANKENKSGQGDRGERTLEGWYREEESMASQDHHSYGVPKQGERNVIYSSTFRGSSRDHRAPHSSPVPPRTHWRGLDQDEYEEVVDSGTFSHYVRKPSHTRPGDYECHHRRRSPPGWGGGNDSGAIPKTRVTKSDFLPDSLQQEARARLRQLQRERYLRPEPSASSFEPQRKTKRVMPTQPSGSPKKSCTCQPPASSSAPYKCPYCTPIHNSDFGHYKVKKTKKKETREVEGVSSLMASKNTRGERKGADKKVIYNPNACTVLIEKHINKWVCDMKH